MIFSAKNIYHAANDHNKYISPQVSPENESQYGAAKIRENMTKGLVTKHLSTPGPSRYHHFFLSFILNRIFQALPMHSLEQTWSSYSIYRGITKLNIM